MPLSLTGISCGLHHFRVYTCCPCWHYRSYSSGKLSLSHGMLFVLIFNHFNAPFHRFSSIKPGSIIVASINLMRLAGPIPPPPSCQPPPHAPSSAPSRLLRLLVHLLIIFLVHQPSQFFPLGAPLISLTFLKVPKPVDPLTLLPLNLLTPLHSLQIELDPSHP